MKQYRELTLFLSLFLGIYATPVLAEDRSPLAPLDKGGTRVEVPLNKEGTALKVPLNKEGTALKVPLAKGRNCAQSPP